jgi:hypothetical protein
MAKAVANVRLKTPTVGAKNWTKESRRWKALSRKAGGDSRLYPLTIKAGYVIGVIYDICESVSQLLEHPKAQQTTYVPAYHVFSSAVDILGRCIRGNSDLWASVADLQKGFKWLANSDQVGLHDDTVVIKTGSRKYTVDMLTALGYYAAHGGIKTKKNSGGTHHFGEIDREILEKMPPLLAEGLQRYWDQLQSSKWPCNRLAEARIIALKDWPVLHSWLLLDREGDGSLPPIREIFSEFDWRIQD